MFAAKDLSTLSFSVHFWKSFTPLSANRRWRCRGFSHITVHLLQIEHGNKHAWKYNFSCVKIFRLKWQSMKELFRQYMFIMQGKCSLEIHSVSAFLYKYNLKTNHRCFPILEVSSLIFWYQTSLSSSGCISCGSSASLRPALESQVALKIFI